MTFFTGPVGITVNPSVSLVALVTLSTALVFGLALMPRPSRATITWSIGFGISMLAVYVWVAASQFDSPVLRALSSGLIVCFEPLLWQGVRYYAGRRSFWPVSTVFLVTVPTVLALTSTSDAYPIVFRIVFVTAAVFAGLAAAELFRLRITTRDVVLPLALVSCAFVVVAVLGVVSGITGVGSSPGDELRMLRDINGVGILLTSQCAAITIVLLVRGETLLRGRGRAGADQDGRKALRARLKRAGDRQETAWSLLDIRLDDPHDLLEASGPTTFASIADAFHAHVRDALPAAADVVRISAPHALVLLPGGDEAVQHHLRSLLERVSAIEDAGPRAAVRVSASVGWAGALAADYDLDRLTRAASAAAEKARDRGGDRWERASDEAAVTLER
jgi:GGDEF domain-containing protein